MTLSLLRPSATVSSTGTVVGASAHAALSDDSDATYVVLDPGEQVTVNLGDFALPAGAWLKSIRLSCRVAVDGTAPVELAAVSGAKSTAASFAVSWSSPATVIGGEVTGWTDPEVDAATMQVRHTGGGGEGGGEGGSDGVLYVYELFFRVVYVVKPTVVVHEIGD